MTDRLDAIAAALAKPDRYQTERTAKYRDWLRWLVDEVRRLTDKMAWQADMGPQPADLGERLERYIDWFVQRTVNEIKARDEAEDALAAARAELDELRDSMAHISDDMITLRSERDAARAEARSWEGRDAELCAALSALRQHHAAAVEAAFREGYGEGVRWGAYLPGVTKLPPSDEDAAWLASEAKARLT